MPNIGRLVTEYDEAAELETRVKDMVENYRADIDDVELTEAELESEVYNDPDILNLYWDSVNDVLTDMLLKKNPDGYWKMEVKCFGWRCLCGTGYFRLTNGEDFLKFLPDCHCTFRVFNYGRGFAVQNFHHDSPTGKEWYYAVPCARSTWDRNEGK